MTIHFFSYSDSSRFFFGWSSQYISRFYSSVLLTIAEDLTLFFSSSNIQQLTHWEVWIQKVHFLGVGSYTLYRPQGSIFWPYMILALIHIPTENKNNVNCKRHLVLKFSTFDLFKLRGWNFVRMIVPWVHHIVKISAP